MHESSNNPQPNIHAKHWSKCHNSWHKAGLWLVQIIVKTFYCSCGCGLITDARRRERTKGREAEKRGWKNERRELKKNSDLYMEIIIEEEVSVNYWCVEFSQSTLWDLHHARVLTPEINYYGKARDTKHDQTKQASTKLINVNTIHHCIQCA